MPGTADEEKRAAAKLMGGAYFSRCNYYMIPVELMPSEETAQWGSGYYKYFDCDTMERLSLQAVLNREAERNEEVT